MTHKQGSSCELGVFHLRIPVIIVFDGGEILIVFYKKNKADNCVCVRVCVYVCVCTCVYVYVYVCVCVHGRTRFLIVLCVSVAWILVHVRYRYTHIPGTLSLHCSVPKFLSSFSRYCYFNDLRLVWSSPAAGFCAACSDFRSHRMSRGLSGIYLFCLKF